jgi:hypothetical protein
MEGSLMTGSRIYDPLRTVNRYFNSYVEIPLASIYHTRAVFSQEGSHRITPSEGTLPPFWLWLPDGQSNHRLNCLRGELEPEVMAALSDHVDSESIVWEVGAARGYFTLAAAGRASKAIAFEASPEHIAEIQRGIKKNGYKNIEVIEGVVGDDVSLDSFEPADIVVMDVEGWEYQILSDSPKTVGTVETWIIEVHKKGGDPNAPEPPRIDTAGVFDILESAGYSTEILEQDSEDRYHVLATLN